jgi:cytosine/adenosine deaminase-related metal-dependent hydrolase
VMNKDDGGALAGGEPADILLIDWDALDNDRLRDDLDPRGLLFFRATSRHVREVIVAGRTIVREGKVLGIDYPAMSGELIARLRTGLKANFAYSAALADLERVLASHFDSEPPCC